MSYWLVRDLLFNLLGVDYKTPPIEIGQRLQSSLNTLLATTPHPHQTKANIYPYLTSILGVPIEETAETLLNATEAESFQASIKKAFINYLHLH